MYTMMKFISLFLYLSAVVYSFSSHLSKNGIDDLYVKKKRNKDSMNLNRFYSQYLIFSALKRVCYVRLGTFNDHPEIGKNEKYIYDNENIL